MSLDAIGMAFGGRFDVAADGAVTLVLPHGANVTLGGTPAANALAVGRAIARDELLGDGCTCNPVLGSICLPTCPAVAARSARLWALVAATPGLRACEFCHGNPRGGCPACGTSGLEMED